MMFSLAGKVLSGVVVALLVVTLFQVGQIKGLQNKVSLLLADLDSSKIAATTNEVTIDTLKTANEKCFEERRVDEESFLRAEERWKVRNANTERLLESGDQAGGNDHG